MVGRVINFKQAQYKLSAMKEITLDGRYTKDTLKYEISEYIDSLWISEEEKIDLFKFIITSFSRTGLIETYNDLGDSEWHKMMRQMVNQEYSTRYIEKFINRHSC